MIRFTDSADSILEYPMSRVILIDASLQSKDAVIDRIEKALEGSVPICVSGAWSAI